MPIIASKPNLRCRIARPSFAALAVLLAALQAPASDTPDPTSVTFAGSVQSELGCPGDWQPDCAVTHLAFDMEDAVWQQSFDLPAGNWEYKAALDGGWDENYGGGAVRNGPNIPLSLAVPTAVKFYYDHGTHWITDAVNSVIAVAPGSFQSELGCSGDWDPSCLRSWLQDPDGDGVFRFTTSRLPAGDYEAKVAHSESWDENYGAGGVPNGPNIPFSVPDSCAAVEFEYELASHLLTIAAGAVEPQPSSVTIPSSFQSELGCPGDWQPECGITGLGFDPDDQVWQGTFSLPAGSWEYKAALDGSWDENYGADATRDGPNIPLALPLPEEVKFYYSDATHWVTDDRNAVIAVAPGSFQSELGCPGDWQPDCLRSWLQDPDGDGIYSFRTGALPAGDYEVKVAHDESWDENYGEGGVPNGPNIPFNVPSDCADVVFNYDPSTHILTVGAEGAPKGNLQQARGYWLTADTLAWNAAAATPGTSYALHFAGEGGLRVTTDGLTGADAVFPLSVDPAGLPADVSAKFPHLAGLTALRLAGGDVGQVPQLLKGQVALAAMDGGASLDATSLQIPGVLDDLFLYDGPLGPEPTPEGFALRLWAPTARQVTLLVYDGPDPAAVPTSVPMTPDPVTGVWNALGDSGWDRAYYLYEVEVYVPSTGRVETNRVTDPYSLSLSADSRRSQVVDLDDADLKPKKWDRLKKPRLDAPEEIVLYELHVRDFSIADLSVAESKRGTFAAFAESKSNGVRHLRSLAKAGLSHVHLLPSFDFATVPERRDDQLEPEGDLGSYPPDSPQQQAAIAAVEDQDGFNWGYDPFHYTVPEGSYATDPEGTARVREFREMVSGLNGIGLRAVIDVVYNHTSAAGQDARSVLDRIVPGYYHRLNSNGGLETSTCCANTASEHAMMEKLLIDSALTWARHYKVDGFRFDLMGHHMKSNMLKLRAALDALTPARDGVDGRSVYVYGEGWNFGEVANGARGENAIQRNMAGTGIGSFSDRLRDGVRGGNPFSALRDQGFVNGLSYDSNGTPQGDERAQLLHISDWIRIGLAGDLADYMLVNAAGDLVRADQVDYFGQQAGYTADPQENISYVAAHDNETLFDTTQLKAPVATSMDDRLRIQNLANSLVALGQGIPFLHAGQELLRSKSMDRDSFNSGDWFNQLDFTYQTTNWGHGLPTAEKNQDNWPLMQPLLANAGLAPEPRHVRRAVQQFQELLRIRRSSPLFRLRTAADVNARVRFHNTGPQQLPGAIVMSLWDEEGAVDRRHDVVAVVFNARDEAAELSVPELAGRRLRLHPVQRSSVDPVVRGAEFDRHGGDFSVPGRTTAVFVAGAGDDDDDDEDHEHEEEDDEG